MLRFGLIVISGLVLLALAGAAMAYVFPTASMVLAGRLVAERGGTLEEGIVYGPAARHRLDVYRPEATGGSGPVVVFLYGGGWRSGERAMYRFIGMGLARRGITAVIPDYRLHPEVRFPGFVEDAALAYAWTARNVGSKCGPVVIGHSAGAYIAAMLALDRSYLEAAGPGLPRPSALVGLSGPYAFDPTTWPSTRDIFETAKSSDSARPAAFAGAHAPPALLFHGTGDTIVRPWNSQSLHKALVGSGVKAELVELNGRGHFMPVLALAWPLRWLGDVYEPLLAFVREAGRCGRAIGKP